MDPGLRGFLDARKPFASEHARWGELDLTIHYYAAADLPPSHLVTSCRAVVLNGDHVLVIRDPSGEEHIVPGGRRVEGESMEDTARREILEETRWTLSSVSPLAVLHFHINGAVPEDYQYPHPDFVQVVYLGRASEFLAARTTEDGWVTHSEMVPVGTVGDRPIPPAEQALLAEALRRLRLG